MRSKGSYICYRRGPCAVDQLLAVCKECGASVVFFNNIYDPLSLVRDHDVKRRLTETGIVARSFNGELLYEPWEVVDDSGQPFTDFAAFWKKCALPMHIAGYAHCDAPAHALGTGTHPDMCMCLCCARQHASLFARIANRARASMASLVGCFACSCAQHFMI